MKPKNKALKTQDLEYRNLSKTMMKMSESELRVAIQAEVNRGNDARFDLLKRLIGRFNRLRGARCQRDIWKLIGEQGSGDVDTVLDRKC